jgi:hypothetical protein
VAEEGICSRIAQFHDAAFDETEKPIGRRWVEMHWVGHWLDFNRGFGLKCQSSPDSASRKLCSWLTHHTSFEFPEMLPQAILGCYGHRFPRGAHWSGWQSTVSLFAGGRELLLEIDFVTMRDEEGAIRLSSFAPGKDDALVEMPHLLQLDSATSAPGSH